ncbi:MAG TPA: tetratricopeptide repeat protein [Thermoanaerobaculia bacterium]|nr:tetratricopeptide repeat protein [Thermoanaerobaculia bacterium]
MNEATDWGSAIAIVSAGLIVGGMFIYFFLRRRAAAPPPADLELRDLEAKRDALVEQLRAEVAPDERTRLEVDAARVLRAIDEKNQSRPRAAAAPAAVQKTPVTPRRAAMVGFTWGVVSVLILGGLGYLVMKSLQPREDDGMQAMQAPPTDPMVAQLEESVRLSPDDLGARISLAQVYLERDNLMGVFEQTQYVLSKNPHDSRALTYQALVRMAMGQQAEAVQMLQDATKTDPMLLDAWVSLAWVQVQSGNMNEAEAAMQKAIENRPDEKQRLEQVLAQMKAHKDVDMTAAAQPGANLPPDHPPVAPPPSVAAPAADGKAVRITIELDPAARIRSGVIYVMARPAGMTAGPPVAVKRVDAASLPVTFDFSSADSMMGQPLPAKMRIEARLDSDGDAATRSPGDPSAVQDSVSLGSTLKLALK